MAQAEALFCGQMDVHGGITVDSKEEPCEDLELFSSKLEASLGKWISEKIRGVWFNVRIPHSNWIPILAKNGFNIHHGKEDMVSLCRWLPTDEHSKIPDYAHHMVGAGAVVINSRNQLLVVCERYRNMPYWKLPGGYVDPGEDIVEGAQREVLEETNVKTEFVSLVAFRHTKTAVFGCSDLYFIAELKPLNEDIVKDDEEIEDIQWMDIDEYLNHPMVHENNRFFLQKYLDGKSKGGLIQKEGMLHPITKKPQSLYSVTAKTSLT